MFSRDFERCESSAVPSREFQQGLSASAARLQRVDNALQLRRANRKERLKRYRTVPSEQLTIASHLSAIDVDTDDQKHDSQSSKSKLTRASFSKSRFKKLFGECVLLLYSKHESEHLRGARLLRELMVVGQASALDLVASSGVVPRLLHYLKSEGSGSALRRECVWAIGTLACAPSVVTRALCAVGAVDAVVHYLLSAKRETDAGMRQQMLDNSTWALGNIAADCVPLRNAVMSSKAFDVILRQLSKATTLLEQFVWVLSVLARGPHSERTAARLVPVVGEFAYVYKKLARKLLVAKSCVSTRDSFSSTGDSGNNEDTAEMLSVMDEVCYTLSRLCNDDSCGVDFIDCVARSGLIPVLVKVVSHLLRQKNLGVGGVHSVLRLLGQISAGSDSQTELLFAAGYLPVVGALASHQSAECRRSVCWTLSNMLAGCNEHKCRVLDEFWLFPTLVSLATNDVFKVRKEAVFALSCAVMESSSSVRVAAYQSGVVSAWVKYLEHCLAVSKVSDSDVLEIVQSLTDFCCDETLGVAGLSHGFDIVLKLEECGVLGALEKLQEYEQLEDATYEMVAAFAKTYFGQDDDDLMEGMFPATHHSDLCCDTSVIAFANSDQKEPEEFTF